MNGWSYFSRGKERGERREGKRVEEGIGGLEGGMPEAHRGPAQKGKPDCKKKRQKDKGRAARLCMCRHRSELVPAQYLPCIERRQC